MGYRRCIGYIQAPISVFTPNDIALFVAMIKESLLEDLFVQSCAVKAASLRPFDVACKLLVARRGINSVGIKALIEHEPLKNAFSVKQELIAVKADRALTDMMLDVRITSVDKDMCIGVIDMTKEC